MFDRLLALDGAALLWIQECLRTPVLSGFFTVFTQLGNMGFIWMVLSAALLLHPKTRRAGFWTLVALFFGLVCTNIILKHAFSRTRPWLVVEGLKYLVVERDPLSFPSGHTCAAFAAGATWARCTKRRWLQVLSIGQAVLMGFSRLYVGVHFPSDVLAGCLVGIFCAWLSYRCERWAKSRRGEPLV